MWFPLKDEDEGIAVLDKACKFNLTYYDSAYVAEVLRSKKILVTTTRNLLKRLKTQG
jgi:predicted nucleic acid-binding protein